MNLALGSASTVDAAQKLLRRGKNANTMDPMESVSSDPSNSGRMKHYFSCYEGFNRFEPSCAHSFESGVRTDISSSCAGICPIADGSWPKIQTVS